MKRIIVCTLIIGLLMLIPSCGGSQSDSETASAKSKTENVIKLTKKKLTMEPGTKKTIRLKGAKASKVKWTTSNRKTATVSKGKIKAKKEGKATITAKYKNKKYKCKVTVKSKQTNPETEPEQPVDGTDQPAAEEQLSLMLGDTKVKVEWKDNKSVTALKEFVKGKPLTIQMSMYGGFEQVGPIGSSLPSNDKQTTTAAGDIVLYSGNQIVVFYGSNSWSYTRLGHITDKTDAELKDILGHDDIKLTISLDGTK